MRKLKSLFVVIAILGFILALGTAGTSDMEMRTGEVLLTNAEFCAHMFSGAIMVIGGITGVTTCNIIMYH